MLKATAGILFYSPVGEQEEVVSEAAQGLPKTPLPCNFPLPSSPQDSGGTWAVTFGWAQLEHVHPREDHLLWLCGGSGSAGSSSACKGRAGCECWTPGLPLSPTSIPLRAAGESLHPLLSRVGKGDSWKTLTAHLSSSYLWGAVGFGVLSSLNMLALDG